MNNDARVSSSLQAKIVVQEEVEANLIHALTRLQHTAFEKEFLNDGAAQHTDSKPEAFFGFTIGQLQFMIAASCFCEVFVDTAIAAIPNAPSSLLGLSNIRGVLIPVFQIHSLLHSPFSKKPIIFVIGKGDSAVGLLIDRLPTSLSLSAHQRETPAKQENPLLQQFIKANYFSNQNHWLLLDGNALGEQLLALTNHIYKQGSH